MVCHTNTYNKHSLDLGSYRQLLSNMHCRCNSLKVYFWLRVKSLFCSTDIAACWKKKIKNCAWSFVTFAQTDTNASSPSGEPGREQPQLISVRVSVRSLIRNLILVCRERKLIMSHNHFYVTLIPWKPARLSSHIYSWSMRLRQYNSDSAIPRSQS